jgi:chromosome segregation protein
VTLEGELITDRGAVSGGKMARPQDSLLKRRVEREKFEGELGRMNEERAALESERSMAEAARNERQETQAVLSAEIETLRNDALQADRQLAQSEQALIAGQNRSRDLTNEFDGLVLPVEEHTTGVSEIDLQSLETERAEARAALDDALAMSARVEAENREHVRRHTDFKDRMNQDERGAEEARKGAAGKHERLTAIEVEREKLKLERAQAFSKREESRDAKARSEAEAIELRAQRQSLLEQSFDSQEIVKAHRAQRASLAQGLHETELAFARLEVKRSQIAQRLLEEFNLSTEDALGKIDEVVIPPDASTQANRLRRDLKALGDVNLGAIEAYQRMSERWTDLQTQREDLLDTKDQLESAVREIDHHTRDQFKDTFDKVQEAFGSLFKRLFEGGEAKLTLTDPDRLLESGVDIEVQLPGKRKQRLEVLSGGERALTAVAFLFGLMEVRPSPLCVLDEVDAALDGRNVERFVDLLKEYSSRSQFIIITHNPTTIEAAQVWYGVTMSEPGVSRVIPYRLSEAEALING